MPMTQTFVTEPQRKAAQQLALHSTAIVRDCRAAAAGRAEAKQAKDTLDALTVRHPEFKDACLRVVVRHRKLLSAVAAAMVLDAILAGPVGEYVLLNFLQLDGEVAAVAKYALPVALLVTELGIARLRVDEELSPSSRAAASTLAVALAIVMPLLVGETAMVEQGGLFGGNRVPALVFAMMSLTLCVHSFVLFTGHAQEEALSFAIYGRRATRLERVATTSSRRATQEANAAADRFATWAAQRDLFIRQHPDAPVPQPHWGAETIEVINQAYGYEVISRPMAAGQAQATGPAAGPAAGATNGPATPGSADDVRQAHERRVRESESEVVGD